MPKNPLVAPSPDPASGQPLAELKQHLLLFVDSPPGPRTARAVYDLYLQTWGDRFRIYLPTTMGRLPRDWSPAARQRFEISELPDLRQHEDWGYVFSDNQTTDSWLFMFHGYASASEPGKASFYRFEFDWQLPPERLVEFARAVLEIVKCVSGYGGYIFQGQPRGPYGRSSFDAVYRWAWRYWGVDVQDLDVTVSHMLDGYKCPSWLTIIGERLAQRNPAAVRTAEGAALKAIPTPGGVILQAGPVPILGDRNRLEPLDAYEAIARALEPLQVTQHAKFGGSLWTDARTMAWLRRFTDPRGFA
jgi:hypothetical protein